MFKLENLVIGVPVAFVLILAALFGGILDRQETAQAQTEIGAPSID